MKIRYFSAYEIKIEAIGFITPSGKRCPKTAEIVFFDEEGKELGQEFLGYVEATDVYSQIENKQEICLDSCLVNGFSLAEYRKTRHLGEDAVVEMAGFSAEGAMFESQAIIDFSSAVFIDKKINFSEASFIAPQVSFRASSFVGTCANFEKTLFYNEVVDFSGTNFDSSHCNFKNVVFSDGKKVFEHVVFGKGKVTFTNAEFKGGDVSFGSSEFKGGLINFRFARFGNGKVDFHKTVFGEGEKNFEGADFGDGEFNFRSAKFADGKLNMTRTKFGAGDKLFVHTEFGDGTVSFVNTNFGQGNISFKLATFGHGKKDFHFCSVNGDMIFERSLLGTGGIDFRAAEFSNGKLSFTRTEIEKGEVNFDGTVLNDMRVMFKYTVFGNGKVNFHSAKAQTSYILFENIQLNLSELIFLRANIGVLNMSACHLDNYVDMRLNECADLNLSETVVRDIIDLMPGETPVNLKKLNFAGMRLVGKIYVDWQKNRLKELVYRQDASYHARAEQFRLLKENFNAIGRYESEDHAYVEFKREEAKAIREEYAQSFYGRAYAFVVYYFKWFIFDKVGKYATDPVRVLISMFIAFLMFTISYELLSLTGTTGIVSSIGDPDKLTLWERSFYHSAITFLTIGYGDYYPSGIIRWISSIEGFAGLFLMSYFTVAFVRKILR